jgi:hypothetical protein
MVDFMQIRKEKHPEAYERMEKYNAEVMKYEQMDHREFLERAAYIYANSSCPYDKGVPVYDAVLYHIIIPELLNRLGKKKPRRIKDGKK